MSMTVYQINYERDDLNAESFHNQAAQTIKLSGSKKWNDAYWRCYTPVATVHTNDLEQSFEVLNLWNRPELVERHAPTMYSMSVGDIVKRGDEFFMVDPVGFSPISVEQI